jgi:nucleotide-binding universal stress UspA family protein
MSETKSTKIRRIVVGVDGSPSGDAALRWAVTQAELTGDTVHAIMAWHPVVISSYGWAPMPVGDGTDLQSIAEKSLAAATSRACQAGSTVTIEQQVIEGYAPTVLIDASADADLLVVGSRGHGTFTYALLGSVSQHCAHHAKCPVVIVRGHES